MTIVEICVEDLDGVRAAREAGADRVELCADLSCGGLTPEFDLVRRALDEAPTGGLQVLVRPRPGDFVHTAPEIDRIAADVAALRAFGEGAPVRVGFVVGVLRPDSTIDEDAAARLREAAWDAPLTFHRGFDLVPDQFEGLETLVRLGYDRVLTTGGSPSTADPARLAALVRAAGDRIEILASGGLRSANVADIVEACGAREVHMRAPGPNGGTSRVEIDRVIAALSDARREE